jgi:hypothetical protein
MNLIKFELVELDGVETVEYENIIYSNCAFIKLHVDGIDLIKETEDRKGVVVWDELNKSKNNSGDFLIITCMCGVADDGGFKFVTIDRDENFVKWTFNDDTKINWTFDKAQFDQELLQLETKLQNLKLPLEPKNVQFPE